MNPTLATIHDLRSTHGDFSDRPVANADLEAVLAAAVRAANASNAQNYAIVVCTERMRITDLVGHPAAVVLVFCVDLQRNIDLANHLGCTYAGDPAWTLLTGSTDAALAAQTAVIAARSLGIDSLISNGVQRGDPRRIWTLLDLPPRNCFPLLTVALGYARTPAEHRAGRLSEPGVIHREKYHHRDTATCEKILEITDTEAFAGPGEPWRAQGHAHFLSAFFAGPGKRAVQAYGKLATALRQSGIDVRVCDPSSTGSAT